MACAVRVERKTKRKRTEISNDWSTIWEEVTPLLSAPASEVHALVKNIFLESGVLTEAQQHGDEARLDALVSAIQAGYALNPYHSFIHATHVMLGTYVQLRNSSILFTRVEKAALLFTAIIHDLEHQGVPNTQLVRENSKLAEKFHNKSVAENNSLEQGLALLDSEDNSVFADFSIEDNVLFRSLCKQIILATDIADGDRIKAIYRDVDAAVAAAAGAEGKEAAATADDWLADGGTATVKLDASIAANRALVLCLMLKTADVGAPLQALSTSKAWAERFYNECRTAHKNGRGPELDHESFFKGQDGFYGSYLKRVIEVMQSTGGVHAEVTDAMMSNLGALRVAWQKEGQQLLQTWASKWDDQ